MVQTDVMRSLVFATLAIFVSLLTEVRTGKILNVVTFPALALTLALKTAMFGLGPAFGSGLVSSLLGAIVYPALEVFVWRLVLRGSPGMGALKLMAVLGAGVGFRPAVLCAAVSIAVGLAWGMVAVWRARDGKKPKVLGSVLVASAWLLAVPFSGWIGW